MDREILETLKTIANTQAAIATALERVAVTQEWLAHKVERQSAPEQEIGDRNDVAEILRIHPNTVEERRKSWTEGVHHWKDKGRRLYALPLIRDLCINGVDSPAHHQAIIAWQQTLLGAQSPSRKRGPKPGSKRRIG